MLHVLHFYVCVLTRSTYLRLCYSYIVTNYNIQVKKNPPSHCQSQVIVTSTL